MKWIDMVVNGYHLRSQLVGAQGLLSRDAQKIADREHARRVFQQHGLTQRDLDLLGEKWCVQYVNARRFVESSLLRTMTEFSWQCRDWFEDFEYPLLDPKLPSCRSLS